VEGLKPKAGQNPWRGLILGAAQAATRLFCASLNMKKFLKFPEKFLWGTSTSAHQIEGDCKNNDWSHYFFNQNKMSWTKSALEKIPEAGSACDSYNRYNEDFNFIEQMNNNCHRLSIEWARIEPKPGEFDQSAINHYRKVLENLKQRNVKIMLTLHHFTNPAWFAEEKSWEKNKNQKYFLRFVKLVVEKYGDLVDFWITFNEPDVYMYCGYFQGWWPPMKKNKFLGWKVFYNMARTHKKAYELIHKTCKEKFNKEAKVGIANSLQAYSNYFKHKFLDQFKVYWKYKTLNHGFYKLSGIKSHDFLGVNYYFPVQLSSKKMQRFVLQSKEGGDLTDMGWQIHPQGLYEVLVDLLPYKKPVYITENGIATNDEALREKFINDHLEQLYYAIQTGADVIGYNYWSLLDNYEWADGFKPKFGLVSVYFETKERKLKPSGLYYGQIAKQNGLDIKN